MPTGGARGSCTLTDCNRPHYGLGLCRSHWRKLPEVRARTRIQENAYHTSTRERRREYNRRDYQKHSDAYKARAAHWQKENSKQFYANTGSRHRAQKLGAIANFGLAQWEHLKALFGHRCAYCHQQLSSLEQDHVRPLSKGGSHTTDNIVPACRSCNARKSAKWPLFSLS